MDLVLHQWSIVTSLQSSISLPIFTIVVSIELLTLDIKNINQEYHKQML